MWVLWWRSQRITKVNKNHPLGTMNVQNFPTKRYLRLNQSCHHLEQCCLHGWKLPKSFHELLPAMLQLKPTCWENPQSASMWLCLAVISCYKQSNRFHSEDGDLTWGNWLYLDYLEERAQKNTGLQIKPTVSQYWSALFCCVMFSSWTVSLWATSGPQSQRKSLQESGNGDSSKWILKSTF